MTKQENNYPFSNAAHQAQVRVVEEFSDNENELPYYHNLKRVQEAVQSVFPNFPMQSNKDFFVS